jgi:EAL and modified HD-GYP domain-containing signal transduction protein
MVAVAHPAPSSFVGRQAVLTPNLKVWAYALAVQGGSESTVAEDTSREVVVTAALDVGLSRVVGEKRAIVHVGGVALRRGLPYALPPRQMVVELDASIGARADNLAAVERLVTAGYTIVVGGVSGAPEHQALSTLAPIVKLDLRRMAPEAVAPTCAELLARNKQLFASGVDDRATFEQLKALGAHLFQGTFLSKPEYIEGDRVPPSRVAAMKLLATLHDPKSGFADYAELITKDVTLSYQLLRYVNSAMFSRPSKVDSIHRALIQLGLVHVRQWASLMVLARASTQPEEVVMSVMIRARMAELMATRLRRNPGAAFTTGMFSLIDVLIGRPLSEVITQLPLADDVRAALLERQGSLGQVLAATVAYELGEWTKAQVDGLSESEVADCYVDAVTWSEELLASMR